MFIRAPVGFVVNMTQLDVRSVFAALLLVRWTGATFTCVGLAAGGNQEEIPAAVLFCNVEKLHVRFCIVAKTPPVFLAQQDFAQNSMRGEGRFEVCTQRRGTHFAATLPRTDHDDLSPGGFNVGRQINQPS